MPASKISGTDVLIREKLQKALRLCGFSQTEPATPV